ncbi:hypothetical protein E1091_13870 [Micromonospora fluostatini]|uniref:Uncharacterized protein n=1 Tax=Micromonospora fluostatini TaxID=1629071 RepID=A0ABY2DF63_9ACTN|nr:hypothetical protein E1091_13870 [Micromonospora fluostatini]
MNGATGGGGLCGGAACGGAADGPPGCGGPGSGGPAGAGCPGADGTVPAGASPYPGVPAAWSWIVTAASPSRFAGLDRCWRAVPLVGSGRLSAVRRTSGSSTSGRPG